MKFVYALGQSPRDWKTTKHQNAVPTLFQTQNIRHHEWKIVATTLQLIFVLQSQGEGHEKKKNHGTHLSPSFPSFPDLLPTRLEVTYILCRTSTNLWYQDLSATYTKERFIDLMEKHQLPT